MKSLTSPDKSHLTSIYSEASISDWPADIRHVLDVVEQAEQRLSYSPTCLSEQKRKLSGSYYTPQDVAVFFWNEFFLTNKIGTKRTATDFLQNNQFIEPAAGAGILIFALMQKLLSLGVTPSILASIKINIVDINRQALNFIQAQLDYLAIKWGVKFKNVALTNKDFMQLNLIRSGKPFVILANPPFAKKSTTPSMWKNSFADFVEMSSSLIGSNGCMHFIVPLSLSFSRDFSELRKIISSHPREIIVSHFDNIPDTLFKSGKPQHTNTNKANSQRCAILTIRAASKRKIYATKLHAWSKSDRAQLLSNSPIYYDVTSYNFDDQIPRPESLEILNYLNYKSIDTRLEALFSKDGNYTFNVVAVARNYIGIREKEGSGATKLCFTNKKDFYRALLIITSDLFYSYWRTVGDGFHVTKTNIYNFPLHKDLMEELDKKLPITQKIWANRKTHRKSKMNAGRQLHSYDLSGITPSLLKRWLSKSRKKSCE